MLIHDFSHRNLCRSVTNCLMAEPNLKFGSPRRLRSGMGIYMPDLTYLEEEEEKTENSQNITELSYMMDIKRLYEEREKQSPLFFIMLSEAALSTPRCYFYMEQAKYPVREFVSELKEAAETFEQYREEKKKGTLTEEKEEFYREKIVEHLDNAIAMGAPEASRIPKDVQGTFQYAIDTAKAMRQAVAEKKTLDEEAIYRRIKECQEKMERETEIILFGMEVCDRRNAFLECFPEQALPKELLEEAAAGTIYLGLLEKSAMEARENSDARGFHAEGMRKMLGGKAFQEGIAQIKGNPAFGEMLEELGKTKNAVELKAMLETGSGELAEKYKGKLLKKNRAEKQTVKQASKKAPEVKKEPAAMKK